MSKHELLSPVLRRVLFIGTNQLSRAALHAPTRICRADALSDLKSAQRELACLIRCLQLQERKESSP
jgi:hypothetical protein